MYYKFHIKWLLILSFFIIISTSLLGEHELRQAKWWYFVDHGLKIFVPLAGCWYVHGYFISNHFKRLQGYPKVIMSVLGGTIVLIGLGFLIDTVFPESYLYSKKIGYQQAKDIYIHLGGNAFLSLICYFVFSNRHTSVALINARNERALLEQEHLRAQLISLQQQISPHFLFNSLSTLKTMVSDDLAKQYIVELASVYRYVLSFNERYLTRLEDELNFMASYLHILHERFQNALKVDINISPETLSQLLPSLSLQLLIENAIKHNICSNQSPLLITITALNGTLKIENNLQPKKARGGSSGTGLKNIIERYKLMGTGMVSVSDSDNKFTVTIPLLNHENNHNRR